VTDSSARGHLQDVSVASQPSVAKQERNERNPTAAPVEHAKELKPQENFDDVYRTQFPFVWRSLRRLGVPESSVDDACQDTFLVVHRRLAGFEGRSTLRSWLFSIALRVASDYRRKQRRKGGLAQLPDVLADQHSPGPLEQSERAQAARTLDAVLETLDDAKRAVFVLAELEQMTAPEISDALGVNVNTVYSRLRGARRDFNGAVERLHRRSERRKL